MTKRELLITICEHPPWTPSDGTIPTELHDLIAEGWVAASPAGYEATAKALDEYPRFPSQADIADPDSIRNGAGEKATELTLPSILLRDRQRTESSFQLGSIQGTLVVGNAESHSELVEVTVTFTVKAV